MAGLLDILTAGKKTGNPKYGLEGKTADQKTVIDYYTSPLPSAKDERKVDEILSARVRQFNLFQMALARFGLDVDQVKEIPPVFCDGYYVDTDEDDAENLPLFRIGNDKVFRSSKYQMTVLLFSSEELYAYSVIFDLASKDFYEHLEEYFYRDIVSVKTIHDVDDVIVNSGCMGKTLHLEKKYHGFAIVSSGDVYTCALREQQLGSLQGMIHLIRDKKSA